MTWHADPFRACNKQAQQQHPIGQMNIQQQRDQSLSSRLAGIHVADLTRPNNPSPQVLAERIEAQTPRQHALDQRSLAATAIERPFRILLLPLGHDVRRNARHQVRLHGAERHERRREVWYYLFDRHGCWPQSVTQQSTVIEVAFDDHKCRLLRQSSLQLSWQLIKEEISIPSDVGPDHELLLANVVGQAFA